MRRLYKYLVTLSLYLPASCGINGSDGPAGAPGAPGSSGSDGQKGGSSLVTVYDKRDQKVGWLLSDSPVTAFLPVLFTSGHVLSVEFVTGYKRVNRGGSRHAISFSAIYYDTNNCDGYGYRVAKKDGDLSVLYLDFNDHDVLVTGSGEDRGAFAYQSFKTLDNGVLKCVVSASTNEHSYSVEEWFRVEPPLSLRAE